MPIKEQAIKVQRLGLVTMTAPKYGKHKWAVVGSSLMFPENGCFGEVGSKSQLVWSWNSFGELTSKSFRFFYLKKDLSFWGVKTVISPYQSALDPTEGIAIAILMDHVILKT